MIEKVMASDIADYIDVSGEGSETYELMGIGITGMGKTMNPQSETKQYVSQKVATTTTNSYQPEYPFTGEMIKSDAVMKYIYAIGRNEVVGKKAQTSHVRVELFESPTETSKYPAQKRTVNIEITDMPREAGNPVGLNGSLKVVTDFVEGTFDITTKTFTPKSE